MFLILEYGFVAYLVGMGNSWPQQAAAQKK